MITGGMTEIYASVYNGFPYRVKKHDNLGHLCGYVGMHVIPDDYKDIDAHGGITFNGRFENVDLKWIGFDCAHAGDLIPKFISPADSRDTYKDLNFVIGECKRIIAQLHQRGVEPVIKGSFLNE